MNRDINRIESIIRYCEKIEDAVRTFGPDESDFFDNVHFQQSYAFSLSWMWENVKALSSDLKTKYSEAAWKGAARLRDVISHKYDSIELYIIWETIKDDVPVLKKECESILTELRSE